MLRKLSIRNYAIIDETTLSFADGLTVITGETGAGKSIAVEALALTLGARADSNVLYDKTQKCVVESSFSIKHLDLQSFFETNDLDLDDEIILRREITAQGKSRAFINDTPVNLTLLKELGDALIDMHAQHESQEMSTTAFQLTLLDSMAKQEDDVTAYRKSFSVFTKANMHYEQLLALHKKESQELDYLTYQLNELADAQLSDGEQEKLEQEQQQLEHAEEISKQLTAAFQLLNENEFAVSQQLKSLLSVLNSLKKFFPKANDLITRIESSRIELGDIASEIEEQKEKLQADPQRLEQIQSRLDLIYRLQKKHHVNSTSALLELQNDLQQKVKGYSIQTDELEKLEKELAQQKKSLLNSAKKISGARAKQIPVITSSINNMLKDVGMPHASIKIEHEVVNEDQLSSNGIDRFQFLCALNKGSSYQEIRKVASGGELSRLMLCFKSLIAATTSLPTLVFDEIDSGISGETAMKVSRLLKKLSLQHQVICITHLPQIAAKGEQHYFVFKETKTGRTFTRVRSLNEEEKITTIAQMIAGEKITPASLASAKELLN